MSSILVTMPFQVFMDNDGNPLESGYIYIGQENLNPITTPISIYWDEELTIPAAQPLRTTNGFIYRNGKAANVFASQNYSIMVKDRNGVILYSSLNTPIPVTEVSLPWIDASTYGESKNDTTISAAMTYATSIYGASGKYSLLIKRGSWTISSNITIPSNVQLIFEQGAVLNIATGVTVTYNGPDIVAPLSQIFSLSGTGKFSFSGPVKEVYPQWWGAVGDGVADDTDFISYAFNAFDNVMFVNGTYLVDYISVSDNQSLITGSSVIIKQKPQTLSDKRVIYVTGSNVCIGDLTIEGNISTDINEQNHGIFIIANSVNGNISNVKIGNIIGENIRGDCLYMTGASGYSLSGVVAGDIIGNNVYRNVVSITGGSNIKINSITGNAVGFMTLDIEPEPSYTPAIGVRVNYIKGRHFGSNSSSSSNYCDGIYIGYLDLDPAYTSDSTPSYPPGASLNDGVSLRNTKAIRIEKLKINGFDRSAIFTTYNSGELGCELISIGSAEITDCAKTDVTYFSYINLNKTTDFIFIEKLVTSITGASLRVINTCGRGAINSAIISIGSGASFIRASQNIVVDNIKMTGGGSFIIGCTGIIVMSGTIDSASVIGGTSQFCEFRNLVATATNLFTGGSPTYETHIIVNSTLNSSFYANGFYVRSYSLAMRFGSQYIWVDSTGDLRIKSSAPTSDTDGTVVGTQT